MEKKSLKNKIAELLRIITSCECVVNEVNITAFKRQAVFHLQSLIQEIKLGEYDFDIKTNDMYKVQAIVGSDLLSDKELGSELIHLLTGADERQKYFES